VSVVCCQVEVFATGWLLVQRGPIDCGASFCATEISIMGYRGALWGATPNEKNKTNWLEHDRNKLRDNSVHK
jgi:hypothetical protein